jgi:hypothetical protein
MERSRGGVPPSVDDPDHYAQIATYQAGQHSPDASVRRDVYGLRERD